MQKLRMLRVNGRLFPFTDILAEREDAVELYLTAEEISSDAPKQENKSNLTFPKNNDSIKLFTNSDERLRKGWVRNKFGKWTRRKITGGIINDTSGYSGLCEIQA